ECPEWAPHTSLGLRPWRNPREAPTRNSTLKACHIANMKDDFHCKATENGQLSIGDRLPKAQLRPGGPPCQCIFRAYILSFCYGKMSCALRHPLCLNLSSAKHGVAKSVTILPRLFGKRIHHPFSKFSPGLL
ncbi:MAG: hypothetical protein ACOX9E_10240, partial [Lentisphaeria bacterium]